jgi:hypothetical protein
MCFIREIDYKEETFVCLGSRQVSGLYKTFFNPANVMIASALWQLINRQPSCSEVAQSVTRCLSKTFF